MQLWIRTPSRGTSSGRARRPSTTSVDQLSQAAHVRPSLPAPFQEEKKMAIEVRIPTILRSYTGGAKTVEGSGDTIADLLTDLDSRHAGIKDRLITGEGGLHRFVNVYINDEDVRFLGALDAKLNDGDSVRILPAVGGGAFAFAAAHALRG